jgi:hypothetical protein
MNDPLEVSPLARRDDGISIRPITGRLLLSPASSARQPISVPCGHACLDEAGCRVYRVPFK